MKQLTTFLILGIQCLFLLSCSSDDDKELLIEISDKYFITKDDIDFYDSSTCILFLKETLNLQYRFGDVPNSNFEDFIYKIDGETMFSGVFYPDDVAAPSPTPHFIACTKNDSLNSDFLRFKYSNFPRESVDRRNDKKIIDFLDHHKKLRNGITCTLEKIETSSINDSILNFKLTVKNNDDCSYLIPDLAKINSDQFYVLTGGFRIKNLMTENYVSQELENYRFDKNIMSLNNLSILKKNNKLTFYTSAKYDSPIEKGLYRCEVQYGNTMYLYSFKLELNQDNGRVWIGESNANLEFEIN